METERPLSIEEAKALWAEAPGVTVVDDPLARAYPLATSVGRQGRCLHRPDPARPRPSQCPAVLVRERQPPQGCGHQRRADRREAPGTGAGGGLRPHVAACGRSPRCDAEHQADPLLRRDRLPRLAAPAGTEDRAAGPRGGPGTAHGHTARHDGQRPDGRRSPCCWARWSISSRRRGTPTDTFVRALNALLPRDVRVLEASEMPQSFHATLDAQIEAVSLRHRQCADRQPVPAPV